VSFPVDGNEMYAIRFKTDHIDNLEIPNADYLMNKSGTISSPQTGTGFTSAKDGSLIPEYDAMDRMTPKDGAEIYKIVGGEESLVAVYDSKLDMFIAAKSK